MILFSILCLGYNTIVCSYNYNFQMILHSIYQNLHSENLRWTHWWLAFSHGLFLCTNVQKMIAPYEFPLCCMIFFMFSYICCALWIVVTLSYILPTTYERVFFLFSILCLGYNTIVWSHNRNFQIILYILNSQI